MREYWIFGFQLTLSTQYCSDFKEEENLKYALFQMQIFDVHQVLLSYSDADKKYTMFTYTLLRFNPLAQSRRKN